MCSLKYGMKMDELVKLKDKTPDQKTFLQRYYYHMPLLTNNCTMNILARYVEDMEMANRWAKPDGEFDYHVLMCDDCNIGHSDLYRELTKVVARYNRNYSRAITEKREIQRIGGFLYESEDDDTYIDEISMMIQDYEAQLLQMCPNERKLLNYLVDIYYTQFPDKAKTLLWSAFGDRIVSNLKNRAEYAQFPVRDENGEEYLGKRYSLKSVKINENN